MWVPRSIRMQLTDIATSIPGPTSSLSSSDKWVISGVADVAREVNEPEDHQSGTSPNAEPEK